MNEDAGDVGGARPAAAAATLLDRTKNARSTCEKSLVKPLCLPVIGEGELNMGVAPKNTNLQKEDRTQ